MLIILALLTSLAYAETIRDLIIDIKAELPNIAETKIKDLIKEGHETIIAETKLPADVSTVVSTDSRKPIEKRTTLNGKRVAAVLTDVKDGTTTVTYVCVPEFSKDTDKPFAGLYPEYEHIVKLYALYKAHAERGDDKKANWYYHAYIREVSKAAAEENRKRFMSAKTKMINHD